MEKPNFNISKAKITDIASTVGVSTKNVIDSVSKDVKDIGSKLGQQLTTTKMEMDKKRLCPIFAEDINERFQLPPMIRVVTYDKRKENSVCDGAVGFLTKNKEMIILNIYNEYANILGIEYAPHFQDGIYYVDHCNKKLYINLEDYFGYLKKARVDELSMLAQDLGASKVKIELKEQKRSNSNENVKASASYKVSIGATHNSSNNQFTNIEVAAEINFSGQSEPVEPRLTYFKHESDILALVKMRMNPNTKNQILSKTYSLQYNNTSGIKVSDAANIDSAVKSLNCGGSVSVMKEAKDESKTILAYSIWF